MTALRKKRMSVDEFLPWAEQQSDRWELFDGVPVARSPERVIHDSAAVPIGPHNSYQPDLLVYCGEPVSGDALVVTNPVIVVEVLSPGNAMKDLRDKLQGYFLVASIEHYLIVDPEKKLVIHHARGEDGVVATRILSDGTLDLAPPGLVIALADIFGATQQAPAG
jgi:Uma2 family endonuclease